MPPQIPEDVKRTIQKLYSAGTSVRSISLQTGVAYMTAYGYTRARERGFASLHEYKAYLVHKKRFKTVGEYNDSLARKNGFQSHGEYRRFLLSEAGFDTFQEYLRDLVQREGGSSYAERRQKFTEERQNRIRNREISDLISDRLEELDENQSWLAQQVGVCKAMASRYVHGKSIPKPLVLKKISKVLGISYDVFKEILASD